MSSSDNDSSEKRGYMAIDPLKRFDMHEDIFYGNYLYAPLYVFDKSRKCPKCGFEWIRDVLDTYETELICPKCGNKFTLE